MSNQWLEQLAPAHAPAPPGWWPLAPGWWVLIGSLVLLGVIVGIRWRAPHQGMRKAALRELRSIASSDADVVETARAIESLLRRYVVATAGVRTVARLSGRKWIELLSSQRGGFNSANGHSLLSATFGVPEADHRDQWLTAARDFVRRWPSRGQAGP